MKICPIQDLCKQFDAGNKPPNHHVRMVVSCIKWLNLKCEMGVQLQRWLKGEIACDIKKIKRLKGGLK